MLNKIKSNIFVLGTFIGVIIFMVVIYSGSGVMLEKRYQNAVSLINDGKWYQAEQALKLVSNYKDVEILKRYVWAHIKLDIYSKDELSRNHYAPVLQNLNVIPENYQGNFKNEIKEFRKNIIQKSNLHSKFIYDYPDEPVERLDSVNINGRYLYLEDEYIVQPHNGLMT
jgi:hypothetical protein